MATKQVPQYEAHTNSNQGDGQGVFERPRQRRLLSVRVTATLKLDMRDAQLVREALNAYVSVAPMCRQPCEELMSELSRMERVFLAANEAQNR